MSNINGISLVIRSHRQRQMKLRKGLVTCLYYKHEIVEQSSHYSHFNKFKLCIFDRSLATCCTMTCVKLGVQLRFLFTHRQRLYITELLSPPPLFVSLFNSMLCTMYHRQILLKTQNNSSSSSLWSATSLQYSLYRIFLGTMS